MFFKKNKEKKDEEKKNEFGYLTLDYLVLNGITIQSLTNEELVYMKNDENLVNHIYILLLKEYEKRLTQEQKVVTN